MDSYANLTLATVADTPTIGSYNNSSVVYQVCGDEIGDETFLARYLECQLGPQKLQSSTLLPITIVYTLIFVTGIIGNLSTCLVIVRSPHLQTTTNYYLFSLAIADIVTLILGLPNDLWVYWRQYPYIFGSVICSLRALVSEMTSNASVLTIVAFTMERYLAICHPLYKKTMAGLSRVIKIITVLWVIAFSSAIPFAILTRISYVDYPPGSGLWIQESAFCSMSMEDNRHNRPLILFSFCVFFVLPMLFIVVLYVMIGLKLKNSRISRIASETYPGNGRQQSSRKVLKILVSVVVTFFLCWAPFHAQRVLVVHVDTEAWKDERIIRDVNEKLYYVAGCFYYFNCTTNPILYNVMSDKYRRAFRDTLCCCFFPRRSAALGSRQWHMTYHHQSSFGSVPAVCLRNLNPQNPGKLPRGRHPFQSDLQDVWTATGDPNGHYAEKKYTFPTLSSMER